MDTSPAISSLLRLDVVFDSSTAKARLLLETVSQLQTVLSRAGAGSFGQAGVQMAASFEKANAQLLELRANAERPIRINVSGMAGPSGGSGAGRGGGGGQTGGTDYLGRSMFKTAAYLGMYAAFNEVRQGADADYTLRRVSVITGQSGADTRMLQRAVQDRYYLNSTQAADAQLAVASLKLQSPEARAALLQTAAAVQSTTGVNAADEANTLYRLALTTAKGTPAQKRAFIEQAMSRSFFTASAIQRIGETNAGGVESVTATLERLEAAGSLTGLDQTTLIALAGTLGGVDPTRRSTLTGAIERLTGKNLYQNAQTSSFLSSLGATKQLRETDPAMFMTKVAEGLAKIPKSKLETVLAQAGFSNVRDLTLMADLAQVSGKFSENLQAANEEMAKGTRLQEEVNQLQQSTKGSIMELKASFSELGLTIVQKFGHGLSGGMQALSHGLQGTSQSPMGMAMLAGFGGSFLMKRIYKGAAAHGLFNEASVAASLGLTAEEYEQHLALRHLGSRTAAGLDLAAGGAEGTLGAAAGVAGRARIGISAISHRLFLDRRLGFRNAERFGAGVAQEEALSMTPYIFESGSPSLMRRVAGRMSRGFGAMGKGMEEWGTRILGGGAAEGDGGFLGKILGKGLMEKVAARGAIAASTAEIPVIDILTSLAMLAPVFGGIAGWLDKLGKKGGVVGIIANGFGILFHTLELVGNVVNKVIDGIMWAVKKILDFPPIKWLLDGIGAVGGAISGGIGSAANWVNGIGEGAGHHAIPLPNASARVVNHIHVNAASQASVDRYLARSASRSAVGYSPQGFPAGG